GDAAGNFQGARSRSERRHPGISGDPLVAHSNAAQWTPAFAGVTGILCQARGSAAARGAYGRTLTRDESLNRYLAQHLQPDLAGGDLAQRGDARLVAGFDL